MRVSILNALTKVNANKIQPFSPYLLDTNLIAEKTYPGFESMSNDGYDMETFKTDNQKVMTWFNNFTQKFNAQLAMQGKTAYVSVQPTGSRSFGASYTESDLECAVVSNNFEDFLDFCRFVKSNYAAENNFIAIKTLAGLPLLIIKGASGFCCPELSEAYPGKVLPQLEVTFRHSNVHDIIQNAGNGFFKELTPNELESYVFNKRYIELMQRSVDADATFEGDSLKKVVFEQFKGALSEPLKCLPSGILQETPSFNKSVFDNAITPVTVAKTSFGVFAPSVSAPATNEVLIVASSTASEQPQNKSSTKSII